MGTIIDIIKMPFKAAKKAKRAIRRNIKYSYDSTDDTKYSNAETAPKALVDIEVENRFGVCRTYYTVQTFTAAHKKGIAKPFSKKTIFYDRLANPVKDCSVIPFKTLKQPICDSTRVFLNVVKDDISVISEKKSRRKIYSMQDCKQILNAIPSSLLRSDEVYQAYKDLVNAYIAQNTNTNPSSFKFDPKKINKKCSEKETKIKNKYLKPRLEALQNYLSRYKEIETRHDKLTDFEEKLSKGEITLN